MDKLTVITIEFNNDYAKLSAVGAVDAGEMEDAVERYFNDPKHQAGMPALWDLREGELAQLPSTEIVKLFQAYKPYSDRMAKRIAIVVESDLQFGIARAFMGWGSIHQDVTRQIFSDPQKAITWLLEDASANS